MNSPTRNFHSFVFPTVFAILLLPCWTYASNIRADFSNILQSRDFVDKTLFIKHFIDSTIANADQRENNYLAYITTPGGFAKSTNLDMLRRFLELNLDPTTGKPIQNITSTENYALFVNSSSDLKIAKERILITWGMYEKYLDVYFGQYPVIFLSFKSVDGISYHDMVYQLSQVLRSLFAGYAWIYELRKSYPPLLNDEFEFNLIFDTMLHGSVLEPEIISSLRFLYLVLSEHFNQHVVLLIDDFDYPIVNAISKGIPIGPIYRLVHDTIEVLARNSSGKKIYAILTGTSQLLVNLNIHRSYFLQRNEYCQDFAFTGPEVRDLYQFRIHIKHHLRKLRQFANGYQIHELPNIKLHNPYDVAYYAKHERLSDTSFGHLDALFCHFLKISPIRQTIVQLFFHRIANVQFASSVLSLNELENLVNSTSSIQDDQSDRIFYSYLYENGYLSCNPNTWSSVQCRIPNDKIAGFIRSHLINHYGAEGINFTDNPAVKRFRTLIGYRKSTPYMLGQLECDLNKVLKGRKNKPILNLNEFEFRTIIRSIVFCNFERVYTDVNASTLNLINKFSNTDHRIGTVIIRSCARIRIILLVEVTYRQNITQVMHHLTQYVPIKGIFFHAVLKYLVINMNEYRILEVRGESKLYSETRSANLTSSFNDTKRIFQPPKFYTKKTADEITNHTIRHSANSVSSLSTITSSKRQTTPTTWILRTLSSSSKHQKTSHTHTTISTTTRAKWWKSLLGRFIGPKK